MRTIHYIWFAFICWLFLGTTAFSQREDKITFNEGVEAYRDGNYTDALTRFESAYERNNKNARALYNAGNAAYLNGDFEKANQYYSDYAKVANSPKEIAKAYYNQGNTYLQQADAIIDPSKMSDAQKLYKQAAASFKNSLKNNPSDPEAKYNLTYALSKIQQNQDQQNQDQENQDQNQDNQDKNNDQNNSDQNQENQDQNKDGENDQQDQQDKGDQEKDENGKGDEEDQQENEDQNGKGQQGEEEQQEQQANISKAQAEQDLDAINEDEEKILKRVYGSKGDKKVKISSGKDW